MDENAPRVEEMRERTVSQLYNLNQCKRRTRKRSKSFTAKLALLRPLSHCDKSIVNIAHKGGWFKIRNLCAISVCFGSTVLGYRPLKGSPPRTLARKLSNLESLTPQRWLCNYWSSFWPSWERRAVTLAQKMEKKYLVFSSDISPSFP